jgi:glycosyltransferase involved in cell wall biosynthesis
MPALVTLHDVALDDFVIELQTKQDPLGSAAVREAAALRGRMHSTEVLLSEPLRDPWCAALSRAARGLIVHSEFGRRYLEEFGCRTPVFVVPHPCVEDAAALDRARDRAVELTAPLRSGGVSTVVVAPGDMHRAKCLDAVIRAVARLDNSVHLVLVGRPVIGYDPDLAIASSGMQARVTLARDVDDADFLAWIAAADVVVDLRSPHRGEVSGSLSRAMQAGRPTIVSGTGTYLDLPDSSVVTVTAGEPDEAELASAIERLADDAELRSRIGAAAAGYVEQQTSTEATANGYAKAIRSTLALIADPLGPARQRWAGALADLGLTESELALGHGLAYARALDGFRPRTQVAT